MSRKEYNKKIDRLEKQLNKLRNENALYKKQIDSFVTLINDTHTKLVGTAYYLPNTASLILYGKN